MTEINLSREIAMANAMGYAWAAQDFTGRPTWPTAENPAGDFAFATAYALSRDEPDAPSVQQAYANWQASGPDAPSVHAPVYLSADGCPVEAGRKFWNNDLRVCEVTRVAAHAGPYPAGDGTIVTQTWHGTTHGSFDTLNGSLAHIGRLARWFEGLDAEDYAPGTRYADVKGARA